MSDHSQQVRLLAAQCFATLISLMPLEVGHLYINTAQKESSPLNTSE